MHRLIEYSGIAAERFFYCFFLVAWHGTHLTKPRVRDHGTQLESILAALQCCMFRQTIRVIKNCYYQSTLSPFTTHSTAIPLSTAVWWWWDDLLWPARRINKSPFPFQMELCCNPTPNERLMWRSPFSALECPKGPPYSARLPRQTHDHLYWVLKFECRHYSSRQAEPSGGSSSSLAVRESINKIKPKAISWSILRISHFPPSLHARLTHFGCNSWQCGTWSKWKVITHQ